MTEHLALMKRWTRPKITDKNSIHVLGGKAGYLEYARWYKRKGYSLDHKFRKAEKELFIKIFTAFFHTVADEITESKGGVSLRGIGYFFIHRIPRKLKYKLLQKNEKARTCFSHHTNNHVFSPLFIPKRSYALQPWAMDGKFSSYVKKKLTDNLKNGYRYKSHVATIKHIIG